MSFVFELPEIGEGVVEGEVVEWKVAVGDSVAVDQPLCDIMTDKATVEVHTPLAEIDESGAPAAAPAPAAPKAAPQAAAPAPIAAAPAAPPAPAPVAAASDPTTRGHTRATPAVRRHAREEGLDIQAVPGTGKGGRVTHDDIAAYTAPPAAAPVLPVDPIAPVALPQVRPSGTEERVRIIGLRRKIAEQMVRAKHTAPHFTYVEEVDVTRLVGLRKRLKAMASDRGVKLTYLPFVIKACSVVFREFPNVNAVMDEERFELVVKGDHNIGVACDTPNGLFVPVVKNVEQKSILHIAAELADLTARTRAGTASLADLTGGTFTITGVGNIGGVLATPILNVPEVAILGFNVIRERPMVVDGKIEARHMTWLSPSFDHRIIDGAVGARFTAALKRVLENPEALLLELV